MSSNVMETLAAVEDRLKKQRTDAQNAAKQAAADAREEGERKIADAMQRAERELGALMRETDEKAKAAAASLAGESEEHRDGLRAQAKQREEEAVSFVIERIVNG